MKNKALISIIVPVYNTEKYLEKCLDSLINQSYPYLEIIVVDDGSTDNSFQICNKYTKLDSRIKVIHQKNKGLSAARNTGLQYVHGKYISFVDSDDYVTSDYIAYLYYLLTKYHADISVCSYTQEFFSNQRKIYSFKKEESISSLEALNRLLYHNNLPICAWAKLYRKDLFNNVSYPIGKYFEDVETTIALTEKSTIIALGPQPKYNYVTREDSITNKNFNEKHKYLITATQNVCHHLSKSKELSKGCEVFLFLAYFDTLNRCITSRNQDELYEKFLKKQILKKRKILFDKNLSSSYKICLIIIIINLNLYKKLYRWYYQKNK